MITPTEQLLKIRDVARALNISNTTAWRLVKTGAIPKANMPGNILRVHPDDLAHLMTSTAGKQVEGGVHEASEGNEPRP